MNHYSVTLQGLDKTAALGAVIAEHLRPGDRVLLHGEMGAGKTTLARSIGAALQAAPPLSSPTFILLSEHSGRLPIWHLDAYRLGPGADPNASGLLDERQLLGVTLIEWPEYFGITASGLLGASDLHLTITGSDEGVRSVDLRTGDAERLAAIAAQWQTQHVGATER